MKIGIIGCGALGSFYGARLCRAGEEVHFLLRSDLEVVRREGVHIQSVDGDFHVRPHCAARSEEIGPCDLVLVGLKTTANETLGALVPPLTGSGTILVTLQNGLGNEAVLAAASDPQRVLGGMCFVCLNRIAPGLVSHTAHGRIVLGEYQRPPGPQAEVVSGVFQRAGIPVTVVPNLEQAHWEKLVWNIPFNGLGVAGVAGFEAVVSGQLQPELCWGPCLPTDVLLSDPRWDGLVWELMMEVVGAANALGYPVAEEFARKQVERTRVMGAYKASTLIDFEKGLPLELNSMFAEPLRQAKLVGAPVPRLEAMTRILALLDPGGKTG